MSHDLTGILVGMGNPLLDITATVDESFLKKYDLKSNDAILADEKHFPLYEDLRQNHQVEHFPGGATLNSIKVAQWLLQKPHCTVYAGCIADDECGKILDEKMKKIGVKTEFQYLTDPKNTQPTGVCAVLINGHNRSLVTNLGAANRFTVDHLNEDGTFWSNVLKAKYFYVAGYFLTVCPPAILKIGKHCLKENKLLAMNLSAPFLCKFFKEPMLEVFPYVDLIFGNDDEARSFAEENNIPATDIKTIAHSIASLKKLSDKPRIVIITQGANNVICVLNGKITEYPATCLQPEDVIDTNGAGDAFVGGFLSQFVQGKGIDECIKCGISTATVIIQRSGCTFPDTVEHTW